MPSKLKYLTIFVKVSLAVVFGGLIYDKVMEWNDERVGISISIDDQIENAPIPEINVCIPLYDLRTNLTNLTFEDILPKDFGIINATLTSFDDEIVTDLKVNFSFYLDPHFENQFGWCYNFYAKENFFPSHDAMTIIINLDLSKTGLNITGYIGFEIQEKGQSLMNSIQRYENIKWMRKEKKSKYAGVKLEISKQLSTKKNKCNLNGDTKLHQCAEKFYMQKMNCSFPWTSDQSLPMCKSITDVKKLYEHHRQVIVKSGVYRKELKSMDCWVPNCEQKSWKFYQFTDLGPEYVSDNQIVLVVDIISDIVSLL